MRIFPAAFSFLLFILVFSPAKAREYPMGSLGHLYADCKRALAHSETPEALYYTYCGAFSEGYIAGLLVSAGVKFEPPRADDPCAADKEKAFARINNRFCAHLPRFDTRGLSAETVLPAAASLTARWARFLARENPGALEQPPLETLPGFLSPGDFCESLDKPQDGTVPDYTINPALLETGWQDYLKMKDVVSLESKYEQCREDLAGTGGQKDAFSLTRCGAEISGFLAALRSTAHLKSKKKPAGTCAKQMKRLYDSFDAAETMCVSHETSPARAARLFLQRVENMNEKQRRRYQGFTGLKALGAIGYETIYSGRMCLK